MASGTSTHIGSSLRALMNDPNGPPGRTSGGVPPDGAIPPPPLMPKNGEGPGDPYEESPTIEPASSNPFSAAPGV